MSGQENKATTPSMPTVRLGSAGRKPNRKGRLHSILITTVGCLVLLMLGCGLVGGGGEEGGDGDNPLTPRPEILTKLAAVAAPDGETVAADAAEEAKEATPKEETEDKEEPVVLPIVQTEEEARNLVWVHLGQCITFDSTDLVATKIIDDWYVSDSAESTIKAGLWKVNAASGTVEPNDVLSLEWESAVASQCDAETLEPLVTPTPLPEPTPVPIPAVADGPGAIAIVWSYIAQCIPTLSTDNFEATFVASQDLWVVTTIPDAETDFGGWSVDGSTGTLSPYAGFSRQWDSVVKLQCNPEALASLSTPTPIPTSTPAVLDASEAITTLWSYLVKCAPTLTTAELAATLNPSKGQWIVITKPGQPTDYGVWTISTDGTISPDNREAARRDSQARAGTC